MVYKVLGDFKVEFFGGSSVDCLRKMEDINDIKICEWEDLSNWGGERTKNRRFGGVGGSWM